MILLQGIVMKGLASIENRLMLQVLNDVVLKTWQHCVRFFKGVVLQPSMPFILHEEKSTR